MYGNYKRRFIRASFLIITAILIIFFSVYTLGIINTLSRTVAVKHTEEVMNKAALSHIKSAQEIYNTLTLKEKPDGNVASLSSDAVKLNLLKAEIADIMMKELEEKRHTHFNLSLMNILGYTVISERGLKIPVHISPVSTVHTEFKEEFLSAGINQTLLVVNLEITAEIRISTLKKCETVVHSIPIVKAVIAGESPNGLYSYGVQK